MSQYPSPGIYSKELDLSEFSSVMITTRVFQIGRSRKGKMKPTLFTNSQKLREANGDPDPKLGFGMYAAQIALDAGGPVYFQRVVGKDATWSLITKDAGDQVTVEPIPKIESIPASNPISVIAQGPGSGYATIEVECVKQTADLNLYTLNVYDSATGPNPIASYTVSADWYKDGMGQQARAEEVVNNSDINIQIKLAATNTLATDISFPRSKFKAGADGAEPTEADFVAAVKAAKDTTRYRFNLMCSAGYISLPFMEELDKLAQFRKDFIPFLDAPASAQASPQAFVDWRLQTLKMDSSWSALGGQDWQYFDYVNNRYLMVPGSLGAIQRAIYTDKARAPWYPIAGYNRGVLDGAYDLRVDYDKDERDIMYPEQINFYISDPGTGYVFFGNKTLQRKLSALSYIHVRRLMNVLYPNLDSASRGSLFELNNSFLRLRLQKILEGYLQQVKDGEGLYKFKVVCDDTNNTDADVDRAVLNVTVYLQPAKAVESIAITYVLTPTGASFDVKPGGFL